jgi:uncharacterized membrane protein
MGVLDDHNHQHTYGNSLGQPTSVAGISAQQTIDTNKRLTETGEQNYSSSSSLKWKSSLRLTIAFGSFSLVAALIAYFIGGIGAVAVGLLGAIAGFLGATFLIITLITAVQS